MQGTSHSILYTTAFGLTTVINSKTIVFLERHLFYKVVVKFAAFYGSIRFTVVLNKSYYLEYSS